MSTALIDRTLSYISVNYNYIEKKQLTKYIDSIFECGADYVEITSGYLDLLGDTDLSEKYILHAQSLSDIKLASERNFAYVTIPAILLPIYEKIKFKHNVIVELITDEYSAVADLLTIKAKYRLNDISMIRLTGITATDYESAKSLINWYRLNFHFPIDICPLNTMLSGSSDAVAFLRAKADAISLSFGRSHFYTSFEDYLITRQILSRSYMPPEIISAICSASFAFMNIFNSLPCGMERLAVKNSPALAPVFDIENGVAFRPFRTAGKKSEERETVIDRQIKTIGLEREIEDAIIDMLKKTNFSFYQNIVKRNIID